MKSLRDSAKELAQFDVAYCMASPDDPKKNRDFAQLQRPRSRMS